MSLGHTETVKRGDIWKALTREGEQFLLVLTDPFEAPTKPMPHGSHYPGQTGTWVAVSDERRHTPRCVHAKWLALHGELVSREQ